MTPEQIKARAMRDKRCGFTRLEGLLLLQELENLQREIRILRCYGNRDCTAQADERLEQCRRGEEPWID